MRLLKKFHYNSPVVLTFAVISFAVLLVGELTNGWSTYMFFTTYPSSPFSLLTYLRIFTHVLGHADMTHFTGNMVLILLIGPILEEKYGSKYLCFMLFITALVTGIIHNLFFSVGLLGASGIVFMMILLASMASAKESRIPLTLVVAIVVYIGDEIISGLSLKDNIANLTHIIGGICGVIFGRIFINYKEK